jgi:serine protease Do
MLLRRTLALALAIGLPLAGCKRSSHVEPARPIERETTPVAAQEHGQRADAPGAQVSLETGFAPVVDRVSPAVVNIASTRIVRPPSPDQSPFFNDPLFREFFGHGGGMRPPREMREQALGSGVIVSADGFVLTNSHVVQGASDVRVSLQDKRELKATIVGQDPKTDIALLRIQGSGFPHAEFGDSSKVRVGDFVLAIGDPLGLGQTVTMGIISAKGRGNVGIVDYEDFIQTDAAINPGNSGGPLMNVAGQLIGINTAIATTGGSRGNQGIGFAVPVNLAREVMKQIEQHGHVIRGWLGVAVQDVTPAMAAALGLDQQGGALVGDVSPDSPAGKAGLARGDVILELDGKPVTDSRSLRMAIAESAPGTRVKLGVLRGKERRDVDAVLGEMPAEQQRTQGASQSPTGRIGLQVAPITPDIARKLDLPEGANGVVVTGVDPGSRAAEAGLKPGDVVQEIDRKPVRQPEDVRRALEKNGTQPHLMLVYRDGFTHYVAIPPESG